MTGLWIMLALGLNVVAGFAGLLDLSYVAFFGIGAYCFALLSSGHFDIHLPFLVVLPVAAVLTMGVGFALGAVVYSGAAALIGLLYRGSKQPVAACFLASFHTMRIQGLWPVWPACWFILRKAAVADELVLLSHCTKAGRRKRSGVSTRRSVGRLHSLDDNSFVVAPFWKPFGILVFLLLFQQVYTLVNNFHLSFLTKSLCL